MKAYRILYYTSDAQKYLRFRTRDCGKSLTMAYNNGTQAVILESFPNNTPLFTCLRELDNFLEDYNGDLSSLIVIMDCSLAKKAGWTPLQALMIEYPEVKFLFDDNPKWVIFNQSDISNKLENQSREVCLECMQEITNATVRGKVKKDFKDIIRLATPSESWAVLRELIPPGTTDYEDAVRRVRQQLIRKLAIDSVHFDFLVLPPKDLSFVLNLVHTKDNLFDVSNIRYAIKQWKYAALDMHRCNFEFVQNSRRDHLAISVEEEEQQNLINSYSLFANGFRVWPVTSASELKDVNDKTRDGVFSPSIIVRDYDLQFYDSSCVSSDAKEAIKMIRGYRDNLEGQWTTHVFDSPCWSTFYSGFCDKSREQNLFTSLPQEAIVSICNRESVKPPVYFVSKGTWNVKILPPGFFITMKREKSESSIIQMSHYYSSNMKGDLCLPGLNKPISGVYTPFMCIPEIRQRFDSIRPPEKAYLDTSREGHSHGAPLDIYSLVDSLIRRAEQYYQNNKFFHAAVLATEAIEYLNGFHEALLLKAYQVLAISENAIAMNTVGGEEETLREDSVLRIQKIENELEWILRRVPEEGSKHRGDDERREFLYSLLNQIFSDCRRFCKEKEHFLSENAFISALAHINEGYSTVDIRRECSRLVKKLSNRRKANKTDSIIDDYEHKKKN